MRIAYLLIVHDNFLHLERLIEALNDKNVDFYIHFDKKCQLPDTFLQYRNVNLISNRVKVYWGGFSMVQATLNLLESALPGRYEYYVLLSGVHYPIKSKQQIYEHLSSAGEFMDIIKGFASHKPQSRLTRYYFQGFNRRNNASVKTIFYKGIEYVLSKIINRKYPFDEPFHGSTWFTISHKCCEFVLDYVKQHPEFVKFYYYSHCPDEGFFHTIIGNSPFYSNVKPTLTYTDWSAHQSGPSVINVEHVELFKKKNEFESIYGKYTPAFARKFTDASWGVVQKIKDELL